MQGGWRTFTGSMPIKTWIGSYGASSGAKTATNNRNPRMPIPTRADLRLNKRRMAVFHRVTLSVERRLSASSWTTGAEFAFFSIIEVMRS